MILPSLFDGLELDPTARKHQGHPNSVAAHSQHVKAHAGGCWQILRMIAAAGLKGLTCDEASTELGKAPNRISGRFSTLARMKPEAWIRKAGMRQTRTGMTATVWIITAAGQQALEQRT